MISAAPFRDRVVHHALTRVLEPIFERRFAPNSYACRTGFGTHRALAAARGGGIPAGSASRHPSGEEPGLPHPGRSDFPGLEALSGAGAPGARKRGALPAAAAGPGAGLRRQPDRLEPSGTKGSSVDCPRRARGNLAPAAADFRAMRVSEKECGRSCGAVACRKWSGGAQAPPRPEPRRRRSPRGAPTSTSGPRS
jgi:hypothetical protein